MSIGEAKRILIVVNSLQAGGAEHAALRLSTDLLQDGYEIIFCTLRNDLDFFVVPKHMQRVNYGDIFSYPKNRRFRFSRLPILKTIEFIVVQFRSIRRFVRTLEPDFVIVFEGLIGAAFASSLLQTGIPVIVSERVNPNPNIYAPHWVARLLRPWIYKHGAICTVQSKGFQCWVKENWGVQAFVTPNHLHESEINYNKSKCINHKSSNVIAVGRFAEQKDFDTLLRAWKFVEMEVPGATLSIFGNGDQNSCHTLISDLGLRNVKCFPATLEIVEELVKHKILVNSSKFEGFPNVVLEALSCGVPVVATRSTDVIDDFAMFGGVRVCNISDFEELALLIKRTLNNAEEYELMKERALITASSFEWSRIKIYWEDVFKVAERSKGVYIGYKR